MFRYRFGLEEPVEIYVLCLRAEISGGGWHVAAEVSIHSCGCGVSCSSCFFTEQCTSSRKGVMDRFVWASSNQYEEEENVLAHSSGVRLYDGENKV